MSLKLRREFEHFTVEATKCELHVDFLIYQGVCLDPIEDPVLIKGHIKWDGCSNWDFGQCNYQIHFCTLPQVEDFGKMFVELYKWTLELNPEWNLLREKIIGTKD